MSTVSPYVRKGVSNDDRTSTEDLLIQVGRGDQTAFALVYDQLSAGVFGTCLAVLRDRDHAAEVTQEVMVEIWRTASRFDPGRGAARTWALTLAHRRAIDRVRSVQAQRNRDQRVMDEQLERPFDVVSEEVEGAMDRERVRHCLDRLSPSQHQAVVLAYYGGRTYREVAEHLAVPLPTVKTRIRDGLLRLRDCLDVTTCAGMCHPAASIPTCATSSGPTCPTLSTMSNAARWSTS